MKKLVLAAVAVGAVMALRPVVKRRIARKMREHCQQMMEPRAGHLETTDPEAMSRRMREHCEQIAAQRGEPVVMA